MKQRTMLETDMHDNNSRDSDGKRLIIAVGLIGAN